MAKNSNPIKGLIKRGLQSFAATFGRHTRSNDQPQLLVLMYHRILPANDERSLAEEPGMLVTPETFESHIKILQQYFELMPLSEWIEKKSNGDKLPSKACAITFDDGWADNYEFAYPILKDLNVPATIFLVSDMIDGLKKFWPERLAHIITQISKQPGSWSNSSLDWLKQATTSYTFSHVMPTQEQLSQLIAHTKTLSDEEAHARLNKIESDTGINSTTEHASLLNWKQIYEMSASGLIEVGSHTCNHIRLNNEISNNQLSHEILDSKKHIEEQTKTKVQLFCFPNGDYSPAALALVKENYKGGVSTNSGWNSSSTDSHLLNRIGIHEDITKDRTAFLARISGWL